MSITSQEKIELINTWKTDPVIFYKSLWDTPLWDKQVEVLEAVRDHKYVCVKSGNTCGKSYVSAVLCLWWVSTNYPSLFVTTAPTWLQTETILWKTIGNLVRKAKYPIFENAQLLKTELRFNDEHFGIGISTDDRQRLQGFHSNSLFCLVDEANGTDLDRNSIFEAITGLHPKRQLLIGNPLSSSGFFFDAFSSPLWHHIRIDCRECVKWQDENEVIPGLVTDEWIQERREEWGDKSPLFEARVLGEFPQESPDTLIRRDWVEVARERKNEEDSEEEGPRIVSCDVASKHGQSETIIARRYGHTLKTIKSYRKIPTTETSALLQWEYSNWKPHALVIDSDGIGEGVSDTLEARKVPICEFHGGYGQRADDITKFKNLRTQFYWLTAKKFEKGLYSLDQIPEKEYELLKNQLCCIKVKNPDGMGRLQIETKEDLMARGIRSPDYADAFVYGEYGFYSSREEEIKEYRYMGG